MAPKWTTKSHVILAPITTFLSGDDDVYGVFGLRVTEASGHVVLRQAATHAAIHLGNVTSAQFHATALRWKRKWGIGRGQALWEGPLDALLPEEAHALDAHHDYHAWLREIDWLGSGLLRRIALLRTATNAYSIHLREKNTNQWVLRRTTRRHPPASTPPCSTISWHPVTGWDYGSSPPTAPVPSPVPPAPST